MIDAKTTICCLIGNPVGHSLSPAMHNSAYAELGLNWAYIAFNITDVAGAVAGLRALGFRGASVTVPHKTAVIPFLDKLDPVAEWIGSVNTIVNDNGVLTGMNTDGAGAMKALVNAGVELKGRRVLLLGSGGAARAIAVTLAARAGIAGLTLLGIIEPELKQLAADVTAKTSVAAQWAILEPDRLAREMGAAELAIHATPIGMHPREGESVVPASLWRPAHTVMDIVYNPRDTKLLLDARAAGARTVYGFEMLLNQGILQFELWTGRTAPEKVMRTALEQGLAGK